MQFEKTAENIEQEKQLEEIVDFGSVEELENIHGGSALACTLVKGTIAASIALCPTTKCSSQCR